MKLVMFMTIVFTVSDNVKNRMISFYADKRRQKTPPYAIFQADDADTNITLYNSGKVVFQGNSADIEAQIWKDLEMSLNNRNIDSELKKSEDKKKDKVKEETDLRFRNVATIGSDEVGTGDYFGPIVVTASYVSKENIKEVMNLGVKDMNIRAGLTNGKTITIHGYDLELGKFDCVDGVTRSFEDFAYFIIPSEEFQAIGKRLNDKIETPVVKKKNVTTKQETTEK